MVASVTYRILSGKLRHIGVTNWDAEHLRIALDAGFPIVSNQVRDRFTYIMMDLMHVCCQS